EQLRRFVKWVFALTVREKWRAFWTVYRALSRRDIIEDASISKAARLIFHGQELDWYKDIRAQGIDRLTMPRFMREIIYQNRKHVAATHLPPGCPNLPDGRTKRIADADDK
ncbi:unnamed protein product, partial [marine sediment metagenome]